MTLFKTSGYLKYLIVDTKHYKGYRLTVEGIDAEIPRFYRSLIPKCRIAYPQMHLPHVSVVRKEVPNNLTAWDKYSNKRVELFYDSYIYEDNIYYWLNVYSKELEDIRTELGLVNVKWEIDPIEGYNKCFHLTIANRKKPK